MATIIKSDNPAARKPYTVRYRDSLGRQRERSFTTRGQAATFANDQERAKRYGGDVDLSASKKSFNDAVEVWLANTSTLSEASRRDYESVYRTWVKPAYAGLTVQDATNRPHVAEKLLNRTMVHLGQSRRVIARLVIVGTLNRLVRDGVIPSHRCVGIRLAAPAVTEDDAEGEDGGFVHLTDAQMTVLAEQVGICAWLQRTMGLRIREALGVEKKDFIDGGKTLRLRWQSSRDGHSRVPLKKRHAGQYRDIPVPALVWNMVQAMPDGPLMPSRRGGEYITYSTVNARFRKATKALGVTGFTSHTLRHQFASDALANGMSVVDLAELLGHSDPSVTLKIYVHAMPDAMDRTRAMMNDRWTVRAA